MVFLLCEFRVNNHMFLKISISSWRKFFSKFGVVTTSDVGFTAKIGLKNGPILTKIGIHIDQTSDYYHAKFYQNRTTLSDDNLLQSCPFLMKFCVVIVRSLVYMYTNFRQNWTIFRPYFGCETHIKGRGIPKF